MPSQMAGKSPIGGAGGNMKFVKPSELSLDFMNPTSNRMGIKGSHGVSGPNNGP